MAKAPLELKQCLTVKPVALAYASLKASVSQLSRQVENSIKYFLKTFLKAFQVDLKLCLSLKYCQIVI